MKPIGYFEGESMTRRKVFAVAGQALGGIAGAAIVLPALGFAIAPDLRTARGGLAGGRPARRLRPRDLQAARDHDRPGHRRGRQDHRLRPPGQHRPRRGPGLATSRSRPAAPTSAARSASSRPPATSSAPATAASTASRARSSAARRCARSTASRRGSPSDVVEIGPRYSVTSQLEPVRARDPGEYTGGIWEYLYPPRPSTAAPPPES